MSTTTIKKIVILGPESTGKTFLCEQLANHYKTVWCPEYAREYLLTHGRDYSYEDLLTIAKGQIALEENFEEQMLRRITITPSLELRTQHPLLIIDTNMWVMKVWCEFVFGKCHPWIIEQIEKRKYDLYLLCDVDLPWTQDGLREYPDLETRQKLFDIYKKIMENQTTPWTLINGNTDERVAMAVRAIDNLLSKES